ncbi:MAG: hypothetical protein IKM97_04825 [Clostridia bacterium]|nr:hypothetical protein [Clostridia bacterium]
MSKKEEVIVIFVKKDNEHGISVHVNNTETINVLIGIAETIQLITTNSNQSREQVMSDINKILDILEEKEIGGKENE